MMFGQLDYSYVLHCCVSMVTVLPCCVATRGIGTSAGAENGLCRLAAYDLPSTLRPPLQT